MNMRFNHQEFEYATRVSSGERKSRIVHRAGASGTELFPGWGPKF